MDLHIADNIRARRKERGLTQEQLAEALGVTHGAVHKWETGQSMPEIRLLVEMAELFETSVDALLGYGWQTGTMAQAAQHIKACVADKNLEEGLRYAERALKKFPNSFEVVYHSAEAYHLCLSPETASRAIRLYRECIRLLNQNPYDHIDLSFLENRIAMCYCILGKVDDAIALFKKHNIDGCNDDRIGLMLSQEGRAEEALPYLSAALDTCFSKLFNTCIGFANAYDMLGQFDQTRQMMQWMRQVSGGLRDTDKVCYLDRADIRLLTIEAAMHVKLNDLPAAKDCLRQANKLALRFDAAPSYSITQLYYCHNKETDCAYDDMGETALAVIENALQEELRPLWEEVRHEET